MTRTKRGSVSASDVRRMGGQPLDLVVRRDYADYARHRTAHGATLDALYDALRQPGDSVTVRLPERETRALVASCEAGGRPNTAAAFLAALDRALRPADQMDPLEHLQMLADLGELEPADMELLRGAMARRDQANGKGLF